MDLKPINIDTASYPNEIRSLLVGAHIFDSSCSPEARVIFIDKDGGYFLKSASKGSLEREATMMRYFHSKGLSASVLSYVSTTADWLLTEKIDGDDCIAAKYLEHPERLCDVLAERLQILHSLDFTECPVLNHTEKLIAKAEQNKQMETYNKDEFPDSFGYASAEEAWAVVST